MRSLLKILLVAGMVAAFGAAAYGLSVWWAGPEKSSAVVVVLEPPPTGEGVTASRARVSLYVGEPHPPAQDEVPIDESDEVNLAESGASVRPRFELDADPGDGTRFFVWAWMELTDFKVYCESVALPPVRYVREGDPRGWVDAETGRPLEPMTIPLRSTCEQG